MKIKPLHDRVLIKRVEEVTKTAGGIIIPDTAKEKPSEGIVEASETVFAPKTEKLFRCALKKAIKFCLASGPVQKLKLTAKHA